MRWERGKKIIPGQPPVAFLSCSTSRSIKGQYPKFQKSQPHCVRTSPILKLVKRKQPHRTRKGEFKVLKLWERRRFTGPLPTLEGLSTLERKEDSAIQPKLILLSCNSRATDRREREKRKARKVTNCYLQ